MTEQRNITQKSHFRSAAGLAAIIESSFDAIISKDLTGSIVSWNMAAERLFGFSADEAVGQTIELIIPDEKRDEENKIMARLALGERVDSFETLRRTAAGKLVPVSITISPIKSQRGKIIGASKIARDISVAKENERKLNLLMREVNHRVKNQYAVILSIITQTAKRNSDIKMFSRSIKDRIMALSHSHDMLSAVDWSGVAMNAVVDGHVGRSPAVKALSHSGPDILLEPNAVLHIGMALHELLANYDQHAKKASSRISLEWDVSGDPNNEGSELLITWAEMGGASASAITTLDGFGGLVLKRVVADALGGRSDWEIRDNAVVWKLRVPLRSVQVSTH